MLVQKMSFTKCRHLRLDCLLFFWGNATDAQVGSRKKKFGEMKWPANVFDVRDFPPEAIQEHRKQLELLEEEKQKQQQSKKGDLWKRQK